MNKSTILKNYKSSIKKWKKCLKYIQEKRVIDYHERFMGDCGFCRVHQNEDMIPICCDCPLIDGMGRCSDLFFSTVDFADDEKWGKAKDSCERFIKKMEKELIKIEKS